MACFDSGRTNVLACTDRGRWAVRQLALVQGPWADRLAGKLNGNDLQATLRTMRALVGLLQADEERQDSTTAGYPSRPPTLETSQAVRSS